MIISHYFYKSLINIHVFSPIAPLLLSMLLPDRFLVAINILLQSSLSIYMRNTTVTSRDKKFTNWNFTWYSWMVKTLDVIASSIISTYDIDKTQNSIRKIPWFHTPISYFSLNGHDTMGDISEWKLAMRNLFRIFGGSFFAHTLPGIQTKHNIKEAVSKGNIWGPFYIPKGKGLGGR